MDLPRLAWTDIETTGLNEAGGYLLEVGIILTDEDLDVLAGTSVVIGHPAIRTYPLDDVVIAMHQDSGLLDDVENSDWSATEAEDYLIDFLETHGGGGRLMAGSNPQFDRRWLRIHMPRLEAKFHYGNFDVHTLRRFFGDPKPSNVPHRSLDDLRIDIDQVRRFVEVGFGGDAKVTGPGPAKVIPIHRMAQ